MRYSWLLAVFFCGLQMSLFAQAPADDIPVREQSMYQTFILLALALAFFYFILWRPEQKRRKAQRYFALEQPVAQHRPQRDTDGKNR